MNLTRDRIHSIGWAVVLTVCLVLTAILTLRVNAVKSEVYHEERRIVAMQRQINFLETEFLTRSNQQALKALNDVEFGYAAPRAEQYIEGERQLAALGKARAPGAPSPIRMAHAVPQEASAPFLAMVSPLTGRPAGDEPAAPPARTGTAAPAAAKTTTTAAPDDPVKAAIKASDLGDRLARIDGSAGNRE